jgi:hypothetical protein
VWLGSGDQILASSFRGHPDYRDGPTSVDAGIVMMDQDLPRTPIPLLLGREARVGESAIVAGWGRDLNSVGATLRAGLTSLSAVGATVLQTEFSTTTGGICAGDSGGPILLMEQGVWTIGGITSAATAVTCNTGSNFYVNIRGSSVTSFILDAVPDAARR